MLIRYILQDVEIHRIVAEEDTLDLENPPRFAGQKVRIKEIDFVIMGSLSYGDESVEVNVTPRKREVESRGAV